MEKIKIGIIGHVASDKSNLLEVIRRITEERPDVEIELVDIPENKSTKGMSANMMIIEDVYEIHNFHQNIDAGMSAMKSAFDKEKKGRRRGQRKGKRDWE